MTHDERPAGDEKLIQADNRGKSILGQGNSKGKGPEVGKDLARSRNGKKVRTTQGECGKG